MKEDNLNPIMLQGDKSREIIVCADGDILCDLTCNSSWIFFGFLVYHPHLPWRTNRNICLDLKKLYRCL